MKVFVTGVAGQLGHDVMNELYGRGMAGIGSDLAPSYSGLDDGTPVCGMPYVPLDITDASIAVHSVTADGQPLTPAFEVSVGDIVLTEGLDYETAFADNEAPGTATVTVKTTSGKTASCTVTVKDKPAPSKSFTWGRDNWNFYNSSYYGHFSSGTYRSQISSDYQRVLAVIH